MQLFHYQGTQSVCVRWLLEEMGLPHQVIRLDVGRGEHRLPDYLKINPHGSVPTLVDRPKTLWGYAAICAHLTDKYGSREWAPPMDSPERSEYYRWLFYGVTTVEPTIDELLLHSELLPESERRISVLQEAKKIWVTISSVLSEALRGKSFLLGERMTTPDVLVGFSLLRKKEWTESYPELKAYCKRLSSRPSYKVACSD